LPNHNEKTRKFTRCNEHQINLILCGIDSFFITHLIYSNHMHEKGITKADIPRESVGEINRFIAFGQIMNSNDLTNKHCFLCDSKMTRHDRPFLGSCVRNIKKKH